MKRKSIYIQREFNSCGACSVASIVSHYGGYVPLDTVMDDTITDRYGTNAYNIVKAFEKYGFISYGMISDLDSIPKKFLPVIAHTNIEGLGHFLVIYEIRAKEILTMDPRIGRKIYKRAEFQSIFDKTILVAIPQGDIVKYELHSSFLKLLWRQIKNSGIGIALILIMNIFIIAMSILENFLLKIGTAIDDLVLLFYIFGTGILFKHIATVIKNRSVRRLYERLSSRVNSSFIEHIFHLDIDYLQKKRVGEIVRKIEDMTLLKEFFLEVCFSFPLNLLLVLLSSIALFVISFQMTLIVTITMIIYIVSTVLTASKIYRHEVEVSGSNNEYYGNLFEYLNGIGTIKGLNSEEYFLNRNRISYDNFLKRFNDYISLCDRECERKNFLLEIGFFSAQFYGLIAFKNGSLSIFNLATFISIYSMLSSSFISLIDFIPKFIHAKSIFRNVKEFLDLKEEEQEYGLKNDFKVLKLENVSYSYDKIKYNIRDLNIEIKRGDKILVRGPSGIGKSTFAKCLAGHLKNYDGHISIDDIPYSALCIRDIRKTVLYVGPDETLFTDTLKENLTIGMIDENLLAQVFNIARLNGITEKRTDVIDFKILENGENLSKGERARVILARALYHKPQILIIDETLSNISEKSEDKILEQLLKIEDLTLIYITHRNKEHIFTKKLIFRKDGTYDFER